ncbi:hypothetical protein GCM10027046_32420 [Uliginosibacterium flavum]|uniref:DUF3079 domain-containing protein n=1 Tax=Uliginosibacterium flavum TaxID=1396831 RepID=A0ABV2TQ52_9RHOO
MNCGNGSERTPHPAEMLGDDWHKDGNWGIEFSESTNDPNKKIPDSASIPAFFACLHRTVE